MEVSDLVSLIPNFTSLLHTERVIVFGWFLHVYRGKERFSTSDIASCYDVLHLTKPNIADTLARLASKKTPDLLKTSNQYRLEMRVRQELDAKYGSRPITIAIEKSLVELPSKLSEETKRKYLVEAIACYRSQCNRAAILMAWNLSYDHLVSWVLADPSRLAKFNTKLPNEPPFNTPGFLISKREHFEWLKESQVVNICGHKDVALINENVKKILTQSLDWRNMSSHPATIEIKQVTTEHTIVSLVENVVLHLV